MSDGRTVPWTLAAVKCQQSTDLCLVRLTVPFLCRVAPLLSSALRLGLLRRRRSADTRVCSKVSSSPLRRNCRSRRCSLVAAAGVIKRAADQSSEG